MLSSNDHWNHWTPLFDVLLNLHLCFPVKVNPSETLSVTQFHVGFSLFLCNRNVTPPNKITMTPLTGIILQTKSIPITDNPIDAQGRVFAHHIQGSGVVWRCNSLFTQNYDNYGYPCCHHVFLVTFFEQVAHQCIQYSYFLDYVPSCVVLFLSGVVQQCWSD